LSARRGGSARSTSAPTRSRQHNKRGAEFGWVECRTADIASPPHGDAEFDAVFAVQVLEYITDLDAALRQIHRMLRPGGGLVIVATDWSSAVWHS